MEYPVDGNQNAAVAEAPVQIAVGSEVDVTAVVVAGVLDDLQNVDGGGGIGHVGIAGHGVTLDARAIERHAPLIPDTRRLLEQAADSLGLSARACLRPSSRAAT